MNTVNVYECIVADLGAGVPLSVIAERYSVKRQTVNRIATGKQTMLRGPRAQRAAAPERARGDMNKHHRGRRAGDAGWCDSPTVCCWQALLTSTWPGGLRASSGATGAASPSTEVRLERPREVAGSIAKSD